MSWFLAFVGFALLVIFHELGHFFAAKAVGMRVERFSLFFPPKIAGIRRGETEYMIGAIPLGGYVKITGMSPDEELSPELKARSYSGSPVWKRIFVILAGPVVNLVLAFLILFAIYAVQGKPVPGVVVGETEAGSPAAAVLREGDRITSVALTQGGRTVTLPGDPGGELSIDERNERLTGLVSAIATGGCDARVTARPKDDAPKVAACASAGTVDVSFVRDGRAQTTQIVPRYDDRLERYRLGVAFGNRYASVGAGGSANEAVSEMWFVTTETVKAIGKIFYDSEARKQVSGVVGSYEATRQSISIDPVLTLRIIALISLSLAVVNLFPFLPLDGGHIFWAVVEKLRGGKRVSTATLERASIVGLMLVFALFFIGLNNDITRIIDGTGFGLR